MKQNSRLYIFGGILAAGVIVAVGAIFLSTQNAAVRGAKFDYASIPQTRLADGGFVLGNPDAPVTVVEFADFMCPHCQTYTSTVAQFIEEKVLTGEAKFEFRMFQSSDASGITFRLVECAVEQDPDIFWVAHDVMFDLTSRGWTQTSSQEFANQLDLNYGDLLNCVREANQWQTDTQLGQRAGVTGTPGIRIRIGDSEPRPISAQYERGGPPASVLAAAVDAAQ